MKTMARGARLNAGNEENAHVFETSKCAATGLYKASWPLKMINLTMLTALSTFLYYFLNMTAGNPL